MPSWCTNMELEPPERIRINNRKEMRNNPFTYLLVLVVSLTLMACNQSGKETKETDNTEVQARGQEESSADHDHHAAVALSTEETTIWTPSGEGANLIGRDFHFIAGSIDQISPKVMSEDGQNVLQLTTSEEQTAFVFRNKMGNVGIAVTLQRGDYKGTIKIIHHAQNAQTYEYVSINNDTMTQGRVIDGVEEVFDTKNFDKENEDWMTIRVSAAGTHFKGYLGDKNITHGHGDEMEAGYVGVMLEGIGSVVIKSMEVTPLEAE